MLKKTASVLCILSLLFIIGCAAHIHKIGDGPQGGEEIVQRQWYILWGLVPLNDVDTHAIAGDAKDYEIRTEVTVLDFVISIFTGIVTVSPRSVTVTK